jgi:hypothetical protein
METLPSVGSVLMKVPRAHRRACARRDRSGPSFPNASQQTEFLGAFDLNDDAVLDDDRHFAKAQPPQRVADAIEGVGQMVFLTIVAHAVQFHYGL